MVGTTDTRLVKVLYPFTEAGRDLYGISEEWWQNHAGQIIPARWPPNEKGTVYLLGGHGYALPSWGYEPAMTVEFVEEAEEGDGSGKR